MLLLIKKENCFCNINTMTKFSFQNKATFRKYFYWIRKVGQSGEGEETKKNMYFELRSFIGVTYDDEGEKYFSNIFSPEIMKMKH